MDEEESRPCMTTKVIGIRSVNRTYQSTSDYTTKYKGENDSEVQSYIGRTNNLCLEVPELKICTFC